MKSIARTKLSRYPSSLRKKCPHGTVATKVALASILAMFAFAALAAHQPKVCNLYEVFTQGMIERYQEQLVEARKAPHGGRYEIWKSAETGSWTVIEIFPDGITACILSTGNVDSHTPDELMQRNALENSS